MDTRKLTYREGHEPHNQALIYDEDTGVDVAVTYNDDGGATAAELVKRWNAYPATGPRGNYAGGRSNPQHLNPMNAQAKNVALAARIFDRLPAGSPIMSPLTLTDVARTLRRAQLTLHRWAELECGTDAGHIEREGGEPDGRPIFHPAGRHVGGRWHEPKSYAIPDREAGALRRIAAACKALGLHYFHQTDPRGCALYVDGKPLTDQNYPHGVACL